MTNSDRVFKNVVRSMIELYESGRIGWCRKSIAKDSNGRDCDINDPNLARCCVLGSMDIVIKNRHLSRKEEVNLQSFVSYRLTTEARKLPLMGDQNRMNLSIPGFNDGVCKRKSDLVRILKKVVKES